MINSKTQIISHRYERPSNYACSSDCSCPSTNANYTESPYSHSLSAIHCVTWKILFVLSVLFMLTIINGYRRMEQSEKCPVHAPCSHGRLTMAPRHWQWNGDNLTFDFPAPFHKDGGRRMKSANYTGMRTGEVEVPSVTSWQTSDIHSFCAIIELHAWAFSHVLSETRRHFSFL